MKKNLLVVLAVILSFVIMACGRRPAQVTSIQLDGWAPEALYSLDDEDLDLSGVGLSVTYDDGDVILEDIDNPAISIQGTGLVTRDPLTINTSVPGEYQIKITFSGVSLTINYAVSGVLNETQSTQYESIQEAIDASVAGDTLWVAPGHYSETIDISNKENLTLRGASPENTVITPASTSTFLSWPSGTTQPSRVTAIRMNESTDLLIENLTFDFEGIGNNVNSGVLIWNTTGALHNNRFKGIGIDLNDQVTVTMYLGADDSQFSTSDRATVVIENNLFSDPARVALNVQNYVDVSVLNNTFVKNFSQPGYGVEMASLSAGEIIGNSFEGFNTFFSDGSTSAAITVHNNFTTDIDTPETKHVSIEDNYLLNNTFGIMLGSASGATHWGFIGPVGINVTLANNTIENSEIAAIRVVDDGASLGSFVTVASTGNTISGGTYGYHISTYWGDGDVTVSISDADLSLLDYGVYVIDYHTYYSDPGPTLSLYDITVISSSFTEITEYALYNQFSEITVTATSNWWGDSSGPEHAENLGGVGLKVSDYVNYDDWLNEKP